MPQEPATLQQQGFLAGPLNIPGQESAGCSTVAHENEMHRFTISKVFHYVSPLPGLSPRNYNPRENTKEVSKSSFVNETRKIRLHSLNYTELLLRHHLRSTDFISSIE